MAFKRARVVVSFECDLDAVPGWGHTPADGWVQMFTEPGTRNSHYNVTAEVLRIDEMRKVFVEGEGYKAPVFPTLTLTTNTAPGSAGQNGAHTPGPWDVGEQDNYENLEYAPILFGPADEHGFREEVALVIAHSEYRGPYGMKPTDWANARLIAAAPQLLEMLQLVHRAVPMVLRDVGCLLEVEAAIAAATGEAV